MPGRAAHPAWARRTAPAPERLLDLLLIGGTRFLGPHVVDAALAAGDRVTLFHRGQTPSRSRADVEEILGDRDGGFDLPAGRRWDAVVDLCGYVPRIVEASAGALASRVERYVFISTISVYAEPLRPHSLEDAPLATLADPRREDVTGESYGGLKALCEARVRASFPGRHWIVRPGLIVGPGDHTNRFAYWPVRLAEGGAVLAPGDPEAPVQWIDARDLAAFILASSRAGRAGTVHVSGPAHDALTMGRFLEVARKTCGGAAELVWVDETWLLEQGVAAWSEMPCWVPRADSGFQSLDLGAARGVGLETRPIEETVRDTLAWERSLGWPVRSANGPLTRAREAEVLAAWRARSGVGPTQPRVRRR